MAKYSDTAPNLSKIEKKWQKLIIPVPNLPRIWKLLQIQLQTYRGLKRNDKVNNSGSKFTENMKIYCQVFRYSSKLTEDWKKMTKLIIPVPNLPRIWKFLQSIQIQLQTYRGLKKMTKLTIPVPNLPRIWKLLPSIQIQLQTYRIEDWNFFQNVGGSNYNSLNV